MHFGIGGSEDGHLFYPKKVVAFRSRIGEGGYIIVDKGENKARLQLFSKRGEFIRRLRGFFACFLMIHLWQPITFL